MKLNDLYPLSNWPLAPFGDWMLRVATEGAGSPGLSLDASIRNAALNLGGGGALDSLLS